MATVDVGVLQQLAKSTTLAQFMSSKSSKTYQTRFSWYLRAVEPVLSSLDLSQVQLLHWNINRWTREDAVKWQQSKLGSFSATAVASAIFAGAGITALQLNDATATNWIARAFLLYGILTGIGSVVFSTYLYNRLSELSNDEEIRFYLSRGLRTPDEREGTSILMTLPLESSVAVTALLTAPTALLTEAGGGFVVGFGLLYLLEWIGKGPTPDDARNIFFFYVAILAYYGTWIISTAMVASYDHSRCYYTFVDEDIDPTSPQSRHMALLRDFWAGLEGSTKESSRSGFSAQAAVSLLKQDVDESLPSRPYDAKDPHSVA